MKKIFISIAMLLAFCMVSCSDESKIESLKEDVIEACAERNFEEARMVAEKVQAINEYGYTGYTECIQIVNDKEIHYLLASNSRDDANRVMYLYNTYEENLLPDMTDVLEVAISQGNDYLAEKLIKGGVEPNLEVIKATVSAENEGLFDLIMQKSPELIEDTEVGEYYKDIKGIEAYNTLIRNVFIPQIANLKIQELPKRPAIGKRTYCIYSTRYSDYQRVSGGYPSLDGLTDYSEAIESFNNDCVTLIQSAIDKNLMKEAKEIYLLMKPNIDYEPVGDPLWITEYGYEHQNYIVKLNRDQINETAKLLR